MRNRLEQILKIACLVLVALVLLQLIRASLQVSQLAGVKIPAVPTLETHPAPSSSPVPGTKIATSVQTNLSMVKNIGTNSIATNSLGAGTHLPPGSNFVPVIKAEATNSQGAALVQIQTPASTNLTTATGAGTNLIATNSATQMAAIKKAAAGTNPVVAGSTGISQKQLPPAMAVAGGIGFGGFPMMPGMPGNMPKLSPEIQARVDKIVNSEIFAPIMHPMPMGLIGIAGDTAFLRTASGQTGLIKVGDSLGDLKLLQIGVNRVLVEQDGQKKELMIFDGYGGESLLSKQDKTSK